MGVYIPTMKKPTSCLRCEIRNGLFCPLTYKFIGEKDMKGCPLTELPHGGLIEKNAVFKLIQSMPSVDKLLPVEFMKALQEIPTVIPAEEEP